MARYGKGHKEATRRRIIAAAGRRLKRDGIDGSGIADHIAALIAPENPQAARAKTLSLFATLIGTLQLSRALANRQLADTVLEQGIHNALALLDIAAPA